MTRKTIKRLIWDLLGEISGGTGAPSGFWDETRVEEWINEGQDWIFDNLPDEGKLSLTKRLIVTTTTTTVSSQWYYRLDYIPTGGPGTLENALGTAFTTSSWPSMYEKYVRVSYQAKGQARARAHYIEPDVDPTDNAFYTASSTENPQFTIIENRLAPYPHPTNTTVALDVWAICRPRPLNDNETDTEGSKIATPELAGAYHHILVLYGAAKCLQRDDEMDKADRLMAEARDELARVTADVTAARGVER